ncbi:MAG: GDP-mannose 4,6-dehydratase [Candidatus Bipolaricaulia bacterium]
MILVTGGAGFIGSHLVERLLEDGHRIVCLDNFNDLYDPKLKERNLAQVRNHTRFTLVHGDILDRRLLEELFSQHRFDRIVHLAALAGVRASLTSPAHYIDVDVTGTLHLLEMANAYAVDGFLFGSSSSIYGISQRVPFREDDPADLQVSPYAAAKRAGELLCGTYHHLYRIPITIPRFFTVYGPRQRPDMAIHRFVRLMSDGKPVPMYGDGSSTRDYTYVDDIIDGMMHAIERNYDFEVFNLGNSETIQLTELIALVGKAVGVEPQIERLPEQPGDVPITYADISKARRLLDYHPSVSIEAGIERFVRWFRNQGPET